MGLIPTLSVLYEDAMNLNRVLFGKVEVRQLCRERVLIRRAISETNGAGKVIKIDRDQQAGVWLSGRTFAWRRQGPGF